MPLLLAFLPTWLWRIRTPGFVGAVVILLAIYYVVVTAIEKWRVHRTRGWPTAIGTLENINAVFKDGGNGVDYWQVQFVYTYSADGKQYSGKYHVNCVTEGIRDDALAGLSTSKATVHYSPRDASQSVLWEDEVWKLW